MTTIIQNVIDAVSLGSLYALIALGVALVFSVMRLVNFAFGELIMVTGYTMLLTEHFPFAATVLIAIAVTTIVAVLMERTAFRPVRGADPTTLMITSFALSYLLQSLATWTSGPLAKGVEMPGFFTANISIGNVTFSALDLITIAVVATLVCALALLLTRSRYGLEMRAAAEDFKMARLLGVRPNRVIALAFAISGVLACFAGIALVANSGTTSPMIGLQAILVGFVASVVGGLGSVPGAAVGGMALGCVRTALLVTLPAGMRPYTDAFLYTLVVVVLLVRPNGLFPSKSQVARV